WDVATGKLIRAFAIGLGHVRSVAYAPDGKTLAVLQNNTVRLWDVATGNAIRAFGHQYVAAFALAPDGKTLASASVDNTVRLLDAVAGKEIRTFGHSHRVGSVAYAPDGKTLASASRDGTILVWDLPDSGRQPPLAVLAPRELQGLWDQLAGDDVA